MNPVHIAIAGNGAFRLAATVSPHDPGVPGIAHRTSLDALLANGPDVDPVALCTPPQVGYDLAAQALARGLHVFLENPPARPWPRSPRCTTVPIVPASRC